MANNPASRINVVNPNGDLVAIDQAHLSDALNYGGYKLPSTQDLQDFQDEQKYGGAGGALKAGLAGAARGATFGLSDQALTKLGIAKPETLAGLKRANPVASGAGEVAGVGGMLLAPELGAAGAAGEGVGGASALGRLANPVKAVSEAGKAVSEAAAPMAGKVAGFLANPETSPIVNKILSKGIATGAGSAVEGAAYGLGQSVSEAALGDPDLNAEKVMSNVGLTSLFMGGIGSMIGGAVAPFAKDAAAKAADSLALKAEQEIPAVAEARAASAENFETAIKESGISEKEKAGLIDGMGVLKGNVGEIDSAANRLEVPAFPGQRSASEFVQNRYGMTTQSPSPFGVAEQQRIAGAVEKVSHAVEGSMGPAVNMSEAELGNGLKKGILDAVQPEIEQTEKAFNEIKEMSPAIPISDRAVNQISRNISRIEGLVNAEGKPLSEGSPEWKFARRVSQEIKNLKTLEDVKQYRTILRRETAGEIGLRHVAGAIQEKLGNLEMSSIERLADQMKTPAAREKVLNLVDAMKSARGRYGEFMDKLSEIAEVGGKRKVWGPKDFTDFIEDLTPEKLAKNMVKLARADSEKLAFLKSNFPRQFDLVKSYVKSDIRAIATKDGALDVGKALKAVDKLSPEAQKMLFTKQELQVLKDAKTWHDAWPKKWGPSGTPQGIQYIDFFKNPLQAAGMSARDYAGLKFAHAFAGASGKMGNVAALAKLERTAQAQSAKIERGAKAIFKAGAATSLPIAAGVISGDKRKDFEKASNQVNDLANNPEKLIDTLDHSTRELFMVAPKMAGSMHQAAIRATHFLQTKLPVPPMRTPFSPKWVPSHAEVEKFNRYYSVVENPVQVLESVKTATVTPEAVETLQAVYPKLYGEMQAHVMDAVMSHMGKEGSLIPYRTKQALSIFLGQDLDSSLTPQSIHANQMAFGSPGGVPSQQIAKPSKSGMEKLTASSRMLTPMQANAQREDV